AEPQAGADRGGARAIHRRQPADRPALPAGRAPARAHHSCGGSAMSKAPGIDARPHLAAVAAVATMPGQPQALFGALHAAFGAVLGHKLFTLMRYHARSGESERIYTTHPREYPVGGRKALNVT